MRLFSRFRGHKHADPLLIELNVAAIRCEAAFDELLRSHDEQAVQSWRTERAELRRVRIALGGKPDRVHPAEDCLLCREIATRCQHWAVLTSPREETARV